MRLWHKNLIKILPRQQLLSQWRECCCIARNIAVNDTPNHILVNKIMNYSQKHFNTYAHAIYDEMISRNYKCDWNKFDKWRNDHEYNEDISKIYNNWHNERYLKQCLYNLEEKAMCGGIPKDEWNKIYGLYGKEYDLWNNKNEKTLPR